MLKFVVSIVVYYFARRLIKHLLAENGLEFPPFSTWVILNTFAIALASIAAIPF